MQIYNQNFSVVFDREFSSFSQSVAPDIERFYSCTKIGRTNKHVLDLCCGTGHLANYFLGQGYSVIGIDASKPMLEIARVRNSAYLTSGEAQFIEGDILNDIPYLQFGLVTCTYDSINHLEGDTEFFQCAKNTHACLESGGFWIFDLNTRASLVNWNNLKIEERKWGIIISSGLYNQVWPKALIRLYGFAQVQSEKFERFEQIISNTIFDADTIQRGLKEAGFTSYYFAQREKLTQSISNPDEITKENDLFVIAQK